MPDWREQMKQLLVLSLMLGVSGCASYSEMQGKPPVFEGQTQKSPEAFVACAAPKILEIWSLARVIPDGSSQVIVVTDPNGVGTTLTLTATPSERGSRVALRQMVSLRTFEREWSLAKACL